MNIKQILFRATLLLLFIPMLQAKFKFLDVAPLGGYNVRPVDVEYSFDTWKTGEYQDAKERFTKANFGFANWAIRMEHQWAFNAYGMSRVDGLVIGKENYLYELNYIKTRNGIDFMGEDSLSTLAKKAKKVQDVLASQGKAFFFVLAPNKADYHPEYLPNHYQRLDDKILTNYVSFSQELKNKGVRHLDIHAWFKAMKDTTQMPLYSKTGIHYSTYGATITAQKIIGEVERQLNKDLPDLTWNELFWNEDLQGSDDDLEQALNLCFKIPNRALAYPQVLINSENKYQPKTIVIGDSFYWQLANMGMGDKVFNNAQFWYYNKEVYPGPRIFLEIDIEAELNNTEAVFIIMSDANMETYLGNFIETLYNFYYDREKTLSPEAKKIQDKIQEIRNNPEWFEAVSQKAAAQNIPLENMIYLDAKYVVDTEKK